MPRSKYKKSENTKQRLLDTALKLFQEEGFEKATMRRIAEEAKMAPGAAYYYFPSKDHMVFEFYQRSYEEHVPLVMKILEKEKDLKKRIAGAVKAHLKVAQTYYPISKVLLRTAINPESSLSPFSVESKELRDKNIQIFKDVVGGANNRIPAKIKERLPEMLWMFKMGMILYWLSDRSPKQKKTFEFVDKAADLIQKTIYLTNLPGVKGFSESIIKLYYDYKLY